MSDDIAAEDMAGLRVRGLRLYGAARRLARSRSGGAALIDEIR
jgi:hypothetical protein